ncbi:MAG: response regulator, partial [Bacteroidetes bacterium]
ATMRATLMLTEEEHLEVERAARADAYTQEVRDILGQQPQTTSYDEALSKLKSLYSISEDEHKILVRKVKRDLGMPDETAVILVVDDEPAMLSATALLLEETYTSVLTADSVEKAGAVLHQQTPDVILSDVGLPGTGGFTFFENIQQGVYGEAVKSVPFVFVSGMGDQYFIKSAKQLGAKAYLVKPYTKEELEKTVMEALA